MTTSASHRRASNSDRSFDQRLSPLIVALGVTAVPNLLLRYQGRLGLTSNEVIYLQHVLLHRWQEAWPWVAISTIVESTGAAERSVRDWKASLIAKGLLTIRTRGRPGGGRGADEHDLSRLFAALEALALEEELQRADDDGGRQQLPTPMYFRRDMASVPQVGRRPTRTLQTERVRPHVSNAAEHRRIEAAENRRATLPESAAINLPVPAMEEETSYKKSSLNPPTPKGVRGVDEPDDQSGVLKPDDTFQVALPKLAVVALPAPGHTAQPSSDQGDAGAAADELLAAFYRGLGADADQLTASHRRRELARARELVDVGVTPEEAEAYARQASSTPGRLAPLDLRWFERERPAWLARWHRPRAAVQRSSYEHDPWQGRRPPISEEDLARGMAL